MNRSRIRLVEETKVGTPRYHIANDVDSGLPRFGFHRLISQAQGAYIFITRRSKDALKRVSVVDRSE
jgi:hypothetical protein